jgi:hypothetical protein
MARSGQLRSQILLHFRFLLRERTQIATAMSITSAQAAVISSAVIAIRSVTQAKSDRDAAFIRL